MYVYIYIYRHIYIYTKDMYPKPGPPAQMCAEGRRRREAAGTGRQGKRGILNSLKEVIYWTIQGIIIGVIKVDMRSLDNSSYIYIYIYIYMHIIEVYIYVYMYKPHTPVYTYVYIYISICVCICVELHRVQVIGSDRVMYGDMGVCGVT